METKLNILLIEDDLLSRLTLKSRLEKYGEVFEAENSLIAFDLMERKKIDLAFVDLDLEEKLIGLEILKSLRSKSVHSVVLSGREDNSIIEKAYLIGCSDFLSKPFSIESIQGAILKYKNKKENILLQLQDVLLTRDENLLDEIKTLKMALQGHQPLLLTGESGTGKTFVAKFFHELVGQKTPFVHLNCSEVSESLIESELFGHEKGAFTGALKNKKGLLELAHDGVLFLDEIATLPISSQSKLLKAIEEKSFYPVGSEKPVSSNFRLVTATCENLQTKILNGEFREDLYFRLEGYNIHMKPLRHRLQDLKGIIEFFLKRNKRRIILSETAMSELLKYKWPGNIRELEKVISLLQSNDKGVIDETDVTLILHKKGKSKVEELDLEEIKSIGLPVYLERIEAAVLQKTLIENNDKVRKTMNDLKLSNNSFYRIMTNINSKSVKNVRIDETK